MICPRMNSFRIHLSSSNKSIELSRINGGQFTAVRCSRARRERNVFSELIKRAKTTDRLFGNIRKTIIKLLFQRAIHIGAHVREIYRCKNDRSVEFLKTTNIPSIPSGWPNASKLWLHPYRKRSHCALFVRSGPYFHLGKQGGCLGARIWGTESKISRRTHEKDF